MPFICDFGVGRGRLALVVLSLYILKVTTGARRPRPTQICLSNVS